MKTIWIKLVVALVLVSLVIFWVDILRPAKSPDVGQTLQQDTSTSAIQPNTDSPQPKRQLTPEDFQTVAATRATW